MEIIINSFGVAVNRDNEGFVISNSEGKQRIPVNGISSIQIGRGAQITSDAIMLAVEHEIDILFTDKSGSPVARVWSPKYGSVSTIRKGQLTFTFSADAVKWIKDVLQKKIDNQEALLLMFSADNDGMKDAVNKSIRRMEDYVSKIKALEGVCVSDLSATLRGWEGLASKTYFDTINMFLPEEYCFTKRTQHPAMDVANAMLNYGYGLLYGKIEGALIKAGVDPYVGVMHRDDYNRPVLAFDVIELYRVWVDYVVFMLLRQKAITSDHYSVRSDGSYWLESLGRRILIQSLNDYLDEVVDNDNLKRSRLTQINLYAQKLAQRFKHYV